MGLWEGSGKRRVPPYNRTHVEGLLGKGKRNRVQRLSSGGEVVEKEREMKRGLPFIRELSTCT